MIYKIRMSYDLNRRRIWELIENNQLDLAFYELKKDSELIGMAIEIAQMQSYLKEIKSLLNSGTIDIDKFLKHRNIIVRGLLEILQNGVYKEM